MQSELLYFINRGSDLRPTPAAVDRVVPGVRSNVFFFSDGVVRGSRVSLQPVVAENPIRPNRRSQGQMRGTIARLADHR
jgi:hypothetical protein